MTTWQACVYKLNEAVAHPYWALVSITDAKGKLYYSLVAQRTYAEQAAREARDYAMMLNDNQLTREQEATTFAAAKLPPGAFMSDAEIAVAPRLTAEQHARDTLAWLTNAAKSAAPVTAAKPKPPRR